MDESVKEGQQQPPIESASRWLDEEWRSFELYEKRRVIERKKKIFAITSAAFLFLFLCALPVVKERGPKWKTLRIARDLSVEIEKLKTLAIKSKRPARMVFVEPNRLQIELVSDCEGTISKSETSASPEAPVLKQWTQTEGEYKILTAEEAKPFSIVLVENQVCFDPVKGLGKGQRSDPLQQVIVIVPAKDLAESRLDRASYVIIEGEAAKVTLN